MTRHRTLAAGLTAAALALAACSGGPSPAASPTPSAAGGGALILSLNQTAEHPTYRALDSWGDALAEATEGRWSIDVFPDEALGAQDEALQLVSEGAVDLAVVSNPQLENLNRDFTAFEMPGDFDDIAEQLRVLNDPAISGELFSSLEKDHRITVLGVLTQGARSVYTTFGPVQSPADLAGRRIRVQETDKWIAIGDALGGTATPMAFGEVFSGLQAGVVDAAENNEISYWTQRHYEVAPHWTSTAHVIGADYVIINTDTLASMSEEDRAALRAGFTAATAEHAALWGEATQEAIANATAAGATFHEIDPAPFRQALAVIVPGLLDSETQRALHAVVVAAAG